jgi:transcriptional regulator with XRE-family HTH domain
MLIFLSTRSPSGAVGDPAGCRTGLSRAHRGGGQREAMLGKQQPTPFHAGDGHGPNMPAAGERSQGLPVPPSPCTWGSVCEVYWRMPSNENKLGTALRAWRERLDPSEVGMTGGGARRTAGLRREELAELAGISVDYLVRLEQGRAENPSVQVTAALARALRLENSERDHLLRLAGLVPPVDEAISDHIQPGLQRVLSRLGDVSVGVFAADWQLVWWNRGWVALLGDPASISAPLRNFARHTFPIDAQGAQLSHWPVTSLARPELEAAVVSDLRRATGRFPNDRRLSRLLDELRTGNATFAELWASGAVGAHREDHKIVEHPEVGPISVDCDVMTDGDADLKIVIHSTAAGSQDEQKLRQILRTQRDVPVDEPVAGDGVVFERQVGDRAVDDRA